MHPFQAVKFYNKKEEFCIKLTRKNGVKINFFFEESMRSYFTKENLRKASIFIICYVVVNLTIRLVISVLPSFNAPAPSCIMVLNQTSNSIVIMNNCESQQKVKIRLVGLALGIGGNTGGNKCRTLPSGTITWTRWWLGKFDRLESC